MSEPTIDEMLELLREMAQITRNQFEEDAQNAVNRYGDSVEFINPYVPIFEKTLEAIRAILEHQRIALAPDALGIPALVAGFNAGARRQIEVEAVRAFIKRVHQRADEILEKNNTQELFSEHFMRAFLDELKAMEKEWSAGSVSNAKK